MSIDSLLTQREPLGPIDQTNVRSDRDADAILNEHVTPFSEALARAPVLLLGRKGSGKSSILAEFLIRARHGNERNGVVDTPPRRGEPFVIAIQSWAQFHELTRHVANEYNNANIAIGSELVPTEHVASLWYNALWDEIIKHFYNFYDHPEARGKLAAVERYIVVDGRFSGSAKEEAERLFKQAHAAILAYALERGSHIVLLIDSMDKYPVRNQIFAGVLGGLLQGVNRVHYDSPWVTITFCLPEEIEHHIEYNSANIMKDYNAAYRIRWKPIDLLKVVAHRYRLFAQLHELALFAECEKLNFESREDIHTFFKLVMPPDFTNALGEPEDPLAYIVRHTQLLPRHAIAIFNAIVARSIEATGQARRLSTAAIREGTADAERIVARQVLVPYSSIYPKLIATCEDLLANLSSVSELNALHKFERRFATRIEDDINDVWKTLFAMGVLGRISKADQDPSAGARYYLAQFHYNIDTAFGLSDDSLYCLHPIFARHFGVTRKPGEHNRTIYPANIEMVTVQ